MSHAPNIRECWHWCDLVCFENGDDWEAHWPSWESDLQERDGNHTHRRELLASPLHPMGRERPIRGGSTRTRRTNSESALAAVHGAKGTFRIELVEGIPDVRLGAYREKERNPGPSYSIRLQGGDKAEWARDE